jgi:cytochrome b561
MRFTNSATDYGLITKLLHWAVALLIIGMIWLGWYMVGLDYYDVWYYDSLASHKALGLLVLELAILKIVWKTFNRNPPLPSNVVGWERFTATASHHFLLAMMLVLPLTGYITSTSEGQGISFFGWYELPAIFPVSEQVRDLAIDLHFYLAYITAVIVLLHAGAAVKHQFIDKDGILRRMFW